MLRNDLLETCTMPFNKATNSIKGEEEIYSTWNLQEALTLARLIEPIVVQFGYHTALGGGVLLRGESEKDVDIILYERTKDTKPAPPKEVLAGLVAIGFSEKFHLCKHGASAAEIGEYKKVFVGTFFGKRVDLFFLRNAAGTDISVE